MPDANYFTIPTCPEHECWLTCPEADGEPFCAECRYEQAESRLSTLKAELERALDEFVAHQSWRCEHPDRYPLDEVDPPDCPCGLHQFTLRARSLLHSQETPSTDAESGSA